MHVQTHILRLSVSGKVGFSPGGGHSTCFLCYHACTETLKMYPNH